MSYVVKHPQKNRIENMIGELFERWESQGLLTCHFLFLAYSSLTQLSPDAEILEESHIDSFNFGVRMHFNADAIRSHFIRLLHKIIAFEQNKELDGSADRMDTIKAYIDRHFAEPLSLNGLAHQFYISKEYLANRFKSKYSVTVHQYLHCIRLRKSADLLQDRQYRISDVALMVGYDNFSYFNKLFRKEFGVTPSEYRERHQQINNVLEL